MAKQQSLRYGALGGLAACLLLLGGTYAQERTQLQGGALQQTQPPRVIELEQAQQPRITELERAEQLRATELERALQLRVTELERDNPGTEVRVGREIAIPLERWTAADIEATPEIEVVDPAGRDLTALARQRVSGEQLRLSAPIDGQFIVRPAQVVSMRLPSERTVLPGGVVHTTDTAAGHVWFRPTVVASPLPVTWNASLRRYTTGLLLGLQLPPEAGAIELDSPVTMRLGFRGMTAEPVADVTLTRAGLEHEQRVDLHFLPTTAAPMLELRSTLGNVDLAMDVLPRVELRPVGSSMPGFGFGTVAVDVVHLLPHGVAAAVDQDTLVSLEIDGGARPEPDQVVIPRGSSSERFVLRSNGFGAITVTATASGLTDRRTIQQTLPLAPLIAALLGGALGGYSRRFQKGSPEGSGRARIVEGAVVAVVVYPAAVLGLAAVAIPATIAATEAGAFLAGALAGFLGVAAIEALSRRLQPAPA